MSAVVVEGVAGIADSVASTAGASAAAALLESARANIAVQRYILGAACGFGIGVDRRQGHDFFFSDRLS